MLDDGGEARFIDGDLEERRDPPDLARQIALQIGEMQHEHIRQVPDLPPAPDILPERPEGVAVAVEPFTEILADVGRRMRNRRPDTARRVVECAIPVVIGVGVMVIHAEDHVAPVAADIDVFGAGREHERVHGEMGLDEPAVFLRLNHRQLDLLRRYEKIEPGRHLGNLQALDAVEDELAHDLLHPGGAGLGVGGNNDVAVAELEVVPDGGIEMVVVQLPGLLRPIDRRLCHHITLRALTAAASVPSSR